MFIELVDALRCPAVHEESWLVASSMRSEFRHIVDGTLGCPVCLAEYPIRRGVVDFRLAPHTAATADERPDEHEATRLAAFLDLGDAAGFAVLVGRWSVHAPLLRALVETPLMVVNPPTGTEGEPGISVIRCDEALPLGTGAARGTALDGGTEVRVSSAMRATKAKGRLVAPVETPLPAGAVELARDERVWVAEREAPDSPLVVLQARRGR